MDNRLIFRYRRITAQPEPNLLREPLLGATDPIGIRAAMG